MVIGIFVASCVLLFVMAILVLVGKGDFLISTLRSSGAEKYNVRRVRLLNVFSLLFTIVYLVAAYFAMSAPSAVMIINVLTGILTVVVIVQLILTYTWAKNR